MTLVLGIITLLCYLFGALAFVSAVAPGDRGTDLQLILAGIYFTCGTVAFAAICIINVLEKTKPKQGDSE